MIEVHYTCHQFIIENIVWKISRQL